MGLAVVSSAGVSEKIVDVDVNACCFQYTQRCRL